jgi:hypothetical protein
MDAGLRSAPSELLIPARPVPPMALESAPLYDCAKADEEKMKNKMAKALMTESLEELSV